MGAHSALRSPGHFPALWRAHCGVVVALSARVTVKRASGGDEDTLDSGKADIFPSNEKDLMASDHCALIHLNEPCILENTRLRFT